VLLLNAIPSLSSKSKDIFTGIGVVKSRLKVFGTPLEGFDCKNKVTVALFVA
jgi:hypothetical protein